MPMAYRIRGEGTPTLDLEIFDYIDSWFGITAKDVQDQLKKNKDATLIRLRVNSGGGDVFEGLTIYNLLAQHKAKVEATVDGLAASIASVIVMAADKVSIAANAMLMIHNAWGRAVGSKEDMAAMGDLLDKIDGQIADLYVARTKMSRDEVVAMMEAETWMTGQEAKDKGFADEVIANKGPAEQSAKALARLDIAGFAHVPQVFAQAVESARREARASVQGATNQDSAGAARTGEDSKPARAVANQPQHEEKPKMMTLEELKEKHPALYAQIVAAGRELGIKEERERVEAHLSLGEQCGDVSIAIAAIKAGDALMSPTMQAKYMGAAMNRRDVQNRQDDSDAAGRALDNVKKTEDAPKDAVDQAADMLWPKKK